MLGIVWLIRNRHGDPVLGPGHATCDNRIQEERNGSLRYCFVSANVLTERRRLLDKKRTLGHRAGIMIVPDRRDESVGIEKAKDFHQTHPRGVQPNKGLIVVQSSKLKTHGVLDPQGAQVRLDCMDRSFDACFEEGGHFQPGVNL